MLEQRVDYFLDLVNQAVLLFREGLKDYFNNEKESFETRLENLKHLESEGDSLRREIEAVLYVQTLIPETRGDVLALLENIDNITNQSKSTLVEFSVECPYVPAEYNDGYYKLIDFVVQAVEEVVSATRAFFQDFYAVKNHLHKVIFFETEADKAAEKLTRKIFRSDLKLSQKMHLRNFVRCIDSVADIAEDVADRLAISTIKRSI